MRRIGFIFLCSILCLESVRAQVIDIKSHKVQKVQISNEGLTRVSIEDDAIQDIFAFPAEATGSFKLHKSGHVFVAPHGLEGPIALTVISASGLTQDLLVYFVKKQPEPLLLRAKKQERISSLKLERWLATISLDEIPTGFRWVTPKREKRLTSQARARQIACYENDTYEMTKWDLEIHGEKSTIDVQSFLNEDEAGKLFYTSDKPHIVVIKKREMKS